jgi:8-oxo-dGTP pyrophosphatase MutT (NUDIX family)
MRQRLSAGIALGIALVGTVLAALLWWSPEFRGGAFVLLKTVVRVLDVLDLGLATIAAGTVWLYRRLRRGLVRVAPPRAEAHARFRCGIWRPAVDFILADGVDLDSPRLLGPAEIDCRETPSTFCLPAELRPFREAIVEAYSRRAVCRLTDGRIVRLERFSLARTPGDEYPNWLLDFSPTSYYDFVCTNLALTESMRLAELPRDALATLHGFRGALAREVPVDFKSIIGEKRLANGLTIHLNVVDADHMLLVGRRPRGLSIYPGKLVTSVTGAVAWADRQGGERPPDPFLAAVREAREEIGVDLRRTDIGFYALGVQADQRHPILLGEAVLLRRLGDSVRLSKDAWENEVFYQLDLQDLPLCAAVLTWGVWIPACAVAVCLALLRRHGYRKVEAALRQPRKDLYRRWVATAGKEPRCHDALAR